MEDKDIDELLKKHFDAVHELDLDAYMDTWADDVRVEFLLTGTVIEGKEDLREMYDKYTFSTLTEYRSEIIKGIAYKNYRTLVERCVLSSVPEHIGMEVQWTLEFKDGKISKAWSLQNV